MKVFMLYGGTGPLVILTSYESATAPPLVELLRQKGIEKYVAQEIPEALARERYGGHFDVVRHDLHACDELRVLDVNGVRAFKLFHFSELGPPVAWEGEATAEAA